jgi:hypothetical membrane protein
MQNTVMIIVGLVLIIFAAWGARTSRELLRQPIDRPLRAFERRVDVKTDRAAAIAIKWAGVPMLVLGGISLILWGIARMK